MGNYLENFGSISRPWQFRHDETRKTNMQMTLPQENYTTILSKSREGANVTEEELVAMDRLIHTLTENGSRYTRPSSTTPT